MAGDLVTVHSLTAWLDLNSYRNVIWVNGRPSCSASQR